MKLAIINCRSIANKYAELEALLDIQNLDLIIGTESHLDETVMSSEVFPSQLVVDIMNISKFNSRIIKVWVR